MLEYNIYEDIAERSGGDVYIGVVGPVRTGKSTLIKNFMTELVLPNVDNDGAKNVMVDELPQSASGKTVMTTEPKFIPSKAVKVKIDDAQANVRLIDCVGFVVEGADGFNENGSPRLISTPWSESPLPFSVAAALGTEKVISDHSTIGVCVTCDGSFGDLDRASFVEAEERAVASLKTSKKPFVIVLNSVEPNGEKALTLKGELSKKYDSPVVCVNCLTIKKDGLLEILKAVLFEFPIKYFNVDIPQWMRFLPADSLAVSELLSRIKSVAKNVKIMRDCSAFDGMLSGCSYWKDECKTELNLANGTVLVEVDVKDGLFFNMLSEIAGSEISDEFSLMQYVSSASVAMGKYSKIKDALDSAEATGYGVVSPSDGDLTLLQPETVKRGGNVGVKLKASAPSYHIVKVEVAGEVSPIMGTGVQGEGIVKDMMDKFEKDPETTWDTELFGKSLKVMVKEGLYGKVNRMQDEVKSKMRRAITRIVNEGKGGVICILL